MGEFVDIGDNLEYIIENCYVEKITTIKLL